MLDRVYLDYNIYTKLADNKIFMPTEYFRFAKIYVSVAHAEEYYNAKENDIKKENISQLKRVELLLTKELNNSGILNPQIRGRIYNKQERFSDCLERVSNYDTRKNIEDSAALLHKRNKEKFSSLRDCDKSSINNSNLSIEEIWERAEIIEGLKMFEERINISNEIAFDLLKDIYGTENALYLSRVKIKRFGLKKDIYKGIRPNFRELELTIEFLQELLNSCGYCSDKNVRTTNSGVYDTEHAIYATYCSYFVTDDEKLRNRVNAIYYFLGLSTQCISFNAWDEKVRSMMMEEQVSK